MPRRGHHFVFRPPWVPCKGSPRPPSAPLPLPTPPSSSLRSWATREAPRRTTSAVGGFWRRPRLPFRRSLLQRLPGTTSPAGPSGPTVPSAGKTVPTRTSHAGTVGIGGPFPPGVHEPLADVGGPLTARSWTLFKDATSLELGIARASSGMVLPVHHRRSPVTLFAGPARTAPAPPAILPTSGSHGRYPLTQAQASAFASLVLRRGSAKAGPGSGEPTLQS